MLINSYDPMKNYNKVRNFKIGWKGFKDIKNVEFHVRNIKKIQTSLCQRGTTADKLNFYLCWSLYEKGVSWNKIYDITDKNCAWDSDNKDNVIRKLKGMKTRFQWKRK